MKIKKIQINGFGRIEYRELELSDGINLIYGENESGKSTIANFIKAIFYGVNKNKSGNEYSEYELRKPWGGQEFSGKMEYEIDGKRFTVFREFLKNTCKVYDENGTDITSEFSKDKSRGTEVGLTHLGIDEETFENTLYVSQSNSVVEIQSQKNIIQKLTNILQSGQESISFEKIKSKLQKKILDEIGTERTHNKPINLIKREIVEKQQTRLKLLKNRERKEELEEKLIGINSQISKTEQNIEQINQVLEIKEKYISLKEEKERTYELTLKIKEKEKQERINNNKKQFKNAMILLGLFTLIACATLLYFHYYIWIIAELLISAVGVALIIGTNKLVEQEDTFNDFNVIKEELNKKEQKELERLKEKGIKANYIEKKASELKTLLTGMEKNKNDMILEIHKIEIEENSMKENIERLSDIEEQLVELNNKYNELITKSKVTNIAIRKLEESFDELKSEVLPELQQRIKNNIKETTNGKYINAIYNNEEGIIVENSVGDLVPASKLSIGTIDQMYLGFRLGISEKMGNVPLLLDESFAYYDDERLKNILSSLRNYKKQIIILTCSKREKELLKQLNISYNYLEM